MTRPSRSAATTPAARSNRSAWDTAVSFIPDATARSVTLIGPAALMQTSSDSRPGSASRENRRAQDATTSGSPRAAIASQARWSSIIR